MTNDQNSAGMPWNSPWVLLLPGLAYYLAARLSLFLAIPPSEAAAVWPAAGIAVGCLLIWGRRVLPGIGLGVFVFYLHSWLDTGSTESLARSLSLCLLLTLSPLVQAVVAVWLIRRFLGEGNRLTEDRSILTLLVIGPVGCVTAATLSLSVLMVYGILPPSEFAFSWLNWWVGDSIGVLVVVPMILVLFNPAGAEHRYRKYAVGIPLLLLLGAVFVIFALAQQSERQARAQAFDKLITARHGMITEGADESLDVLLFMKSFFEASSWVSESDFKAFTALPLHQHGHILALEWIPRIERAQRAAFEAEGQPGWSIRQPDAEGRMQPAPDAEVYFPIRYLQPVPGNEKALGFNVLHNPEASKALERALATGKPTATATLKLVQDAEDRQGFVIYLPVTLGVADSAQPAGVVAAVFRLEGFIATLNGHSGESRSPISQRLVDLSDGGRELFRSPDLESAMALDQRLHLKMTRPLEIAGRRWQVEYFPNARFVEEHSFWGSWAVLVGGMLLVTLLGGWLLSLTGRNIQISRLVREKTEFLQQEIDQRHRMEAELTKLSSAVEHSPNMVVITDAAGTVEYVNPRFAQITGYDPDEVLGQSVVNLQAGEAEGADYAEIWCRLRSDPEWSGEVLSARKAGEPYWAQVHISAIYDDRGECSHYVLLLQDITESKRISEQVSYQASHDMLTGLINRREFERRLQLLLSTAKATDTEHAFCFLDLDQFKVVNDSSGHVAGDRLLHQLGELLQDKVRRSDTLGRLGGDEFGLLMEHCSLANAQRMAEQLREAVEQFRFVWEDRVYSVGVSIGLVSINGGTQSATELFKQADSACYVAKDRGRNRIHVYKDDDAVLAQRNGEISWVADINAALEEDRFELHGQLIKPIRAGVALPGVEILLRLRTPEGRLVPPGAFLAAAERYNISTRIDRWVIDNVFKWLAREPDVLGRIGYCAINLSGLSLGDKGVLETLDRQLSRRLVPGEMVKFEITETTAISNLTEAKAFMNAVKRYGCQFALDDFGSGVSSFAYLKYLPVSALKIDGLFVKDILDDEIDFAMVRAINEVGHVMGMETIAEFVENEAILERLASIGVDYAQGYGICRPMPLEELMTHPLLAGYQQIPTLTLQEV